MTEKTELEFGGATISGNKILLIGRLMGLIGWSMRGRLEVSKRVIAPEPAITEYVSPDFSGYDAALAVLETRLTDQSRILDTGEAVS